MREFEKEYEEWLERNNSARKAPLSKTEDGTEIKLLYIPDDIERFDYARDLGFSGEYPFTRHPYAAGFRGRHWQMRLYSGFGSSEDTNARWKFLLASGNNGVSGAFDLPTQMGYDSDHPEVGDEIGRVGVAIDTIDDFELLFNGIPLDKVAASFNMNDASIIILAMLIAHAEKTGVPLSKLTGSVANDILLEYLVRGTWRFSLQHSLRLHSDVTSFCIKYLPKFYPVNVRGILLHETGATPAMEIGISFAAAFKYIDECLKQGVSIDDYGPRLSFFFASGPHFFEEAAKYRAARRLWARLISERYNPSNASSMVMKFTACFGGHWYQLREPEVNIIRAAYGILGPVLGGVQGMLLGGYDEAYAIPTERTAHLALRTQQVCAEETDAAACVDPLGGSYFVESLTNQIESKIVEFLDNLEKDGGLVKGIENGSLQKKIHDQSYKTQKALDQGDRVVVGVNKYLSEGLQTEEKLDLHKLDPESVERQLKRLAEIKRTRDGRAVMSALSQLKVAARKEDNLVPAVVECVKKHASIGEIMETFAEVFGEFKEPKVF